jgi:hypothetical protein
MRTDGLAGEQVTLVCALLLAFGVALLYLHRRGRQALLRSLWVPALGVVALSMPDALVTLQGTWAAPTNEANPFVAVFLRWLGWRGLCLAFPLWILGWTLFLDALESWRQRLSLRRAHWIGQLQLFTVYALAMGHLDGLSSWTHVPALFYHASNAVVSLLLQHGPWPLDVFPLGYVLYPSLVFGAACVLAHVCTVSGTHGMRVRLASARVA